MNQLTALPTSPTGTFVTVRCSCGWLAACDSSARHWRLASHHASHEPERLAMIPPVKAGAAELAITGARGSAGIAAPRLVADLTMASRVLSAADDGASDCVLPVRLLAEIVATARVSATVLRASAHRREVADELDGAAYELATYLADIALPAGDVPGLWARAPQVRDAALPELEACLLATSAILATPLLVELPPIGAAATATEGCPVRDLAEELVGLGPALRAVESALCTRVATVQRNRRPLPTVADVVLDEIADAVVALHLGALRATVLNELLATCGEGDLVRWATVTTATLNTRCHALAQPATLLLELLDPPRDPAGRRAHNDGRAVDGTRVR